MNMLDSEMANYLSADALVNEDDVDMVELSGALHTALLDFENVAEQWFTGQNPFVKHQVESDQPAMSEIVEVLINRLELS